MKTIMYQGSTPVVDMLFIDKRLHYKCECFFCNKVLIMKPSTIKHINSCGCQTLRLQSFAVLKRHSKLLSKKGRAGLYEAVHKRKYSKFEDLMKDWNPESHHGKTKRLPIFGGIVGQEYIRNFVYVDEDIYNKWSRVMWTGGKNGYCNMNFSIRNSDILGVPNNRRRNIKLHREVMSLSETTIENRSVGDHINRNVYDNRRSNLRVATQVENVMNSVGSGVTSKYKGVSWQAKKQRYRVQVLHENHNIYIGSFICEDEAALFYDKAVLELKGEFAYINFPRK